MKSEMQKWRNVFMGVEDFTEILQRGYLPHILCLLGNTLLYEDGIRTLIHGKRSKRGRRIRSAHPQNLLHRLKFVKVLRRTYLFVC